MSQPALDLSPARIGRAAGLIDPVFLHSPQLADEQLCAELGRRVTVKVETVNPVRSFKGRGADLLMREVDPSRRVVCASAGNFGQAIAFAGRRRGIAVTVFAPAGANPDKLARMTGLGARVTAAGRDFMEAKEAARAYARQHPDCLFVEDGNDAALAEGAGTIALELLAGGPVDTVVVPVGDGSLITGMACWIKEHAPRTRVVGVAARGAPSMAESWRAGKPVGGAPVDTIADGLAISLPVPASLARMRVLVDDMVLVDDPQLIEGIRLAARTLGLLLEPAGAAGLAAIAAHQLPGERLATVLTGSNLRPDLLPAVLSG